MTRDEALEHVRQVLRIIEEKQHDAESAHGYEDELRAWVLRNIASGDIEPGDAAVVAREAMRSEQLDFNRWCA